MADLSRVKRLKITDGHLQAANRLLVDLDPTGYPQASDLTLLEIRAAPDATEAKLRERLDELILNGLGRALRGGYWAELAKAASHLGFEDRVATCKDQQIVSLRRLPES